MEDNQPEEDSTEARLAEINSKLREEGEGSGGDSLYQEMPPALLWKVATVLQSSSSDDSELSSQEQQAAPLPGPEAVNAADPQEDLDQDLGIIASEASNAGVPPQPPQPPPSADPVDNDTHDVHVPAAAAAPALAASAPPEDPLLVNGGQALRASRPLEAVVEDDSQSDSDPEPQEIAVVDGGEHAGLPDAPEQRPPSVNGDYGSGVPQPQEDGVVVAHHQDSDEPKLQEDAVLVGDQEDRDVPREDAVLMDDQQVPEPQEDAVRSDAQDACFHEPQEDAVGSDAQDACFHEPQEDAVGSDAQDACLPEAQEDAQSVCVPELGEDAVGSHTQDGCEHELGDDAVGSHAQDGCEPELEADAVGIHAQDGCEHELGEDAVGIHAQDGCEHELGEDAVHSHAQDGCEPQLEEDAVGGLADGVPAPTLGAVECGVQEVTVPAHSEYSIDSDVSVSTVQTEPTAPSDDTLKFDVQEAVPDDAMDTDQVIAPAPSPVLPDGGHAGLAGHSGRQGRQGRQGLGDSDSSQQAGLGVMQGLQGALPSEADLIRALRRHCCWVCGASAPSHDANISHMVTHLQGSGGSAASTAILISPVSSDTSLADTAPMPQLGPSPSRDGDQVKQNNSLSGCKEEPSSLLEDSPLWTSSPTPAAEPPEPGDPPRTQQVDDRVGDDCNTFPSSARDASTPPLPSPVLQEPETESEVTHFRGPPRFSYAGRKGANATAKRLSRLRARALIPTSACASCPQPDRTPSPPQPADAGVDTEGLKLHDGKELTASPPEAPTPDQDGGGEADADPGALVCAICLQAFPSRAVLLEHVAGEVRAFGQQARRGRKPRAVTTPPSPRAAERISCPQCSATFARRYDLRCHARAAHPDAANGEAGEQHGDGRPHACRLCPMRFRRLSHLQQHTLVHTGAKPFGCQVCGEHFRRKDRLVMHVKQHKQRKGPAAKAGARTAAKTQSMQAALEPKPEPKFPIKTVHPASPKAAVEVPADGAPVKSESEEATEPPPAPTPAKRGRGRPRKAVAGAVLAAKVAQLSEASLRLAEAESPAPAPATLAATKKAKSTKAAPEDARQHCHTCGKVFPAKSKLRQHVLKTHASSMRHVCLTCGQSNPSHEQLLAHVAVHIQQRMRERAVKKGQAEGNVKTEPAEEVVDEGALKTGHGPLTRSALASAADPASGSAAAPSPGPDPAPTPADPTAKPKTQMVLKFVSKHSVKDAASVAAKFLPQLARDLASKGGLKNLSTDSKNRKVVYMMMAKSSAEGRNASETAGAAGDAGAPGKTGITRKVIFKVVPKKRDLQEGSENTPEQPKPGLKVVSRMVSVDGANNASEQASRTVGPNAPMSVAGVFPLALADPIIKTEAMDVIERTSTPARAEGVTAGTRLKSSTSASTTSPRAVPYPGLTSTATTRTPPATRGSARSSPRIPFGASPLSNVVAKALISPQADNRYLCDKCGGRFLGETAYLQHVRSHGVTQIKAYQCHCCYVKFFDKELLKAHMHTHL